MAKKEWWDFGDSKRQPSGKRGGSKDMKRQAMIALMKVLEGMKYVVLTHPSKVLANEQAMTALAHMATDFPWAEEQGYGGPKYAKMVDAARKLAQGDESGLEDLQAAGYDLGKLEKRYGKLFPQQAPKEKPKDEPPTEELPETPPEEPNESKGLDDDINAVLD